MINVLVKYLQKNINKLVNRELKKEKFENCKKKTGNSRIVERKELIKLN